MSGALERELVIGILRARVGTVPRALALAEIDGAELTEILQKMSPEMAS